MVIFFLFRGERLNLSRDFRDEDMQSMASLMSVNNNSDIAPLDDFDNEDIPEDVEEVSIRNIDEILDISAQLDLMTNSLTDNDMPSTPISGRCLSKGRYCKKNISFPFEITQPFVFLPKQWLAYQRTKRLH